MKTKVTGITRHIVPFEIEIDFFPLYFSLLKLCGNNYQLNIYVPDTVIDNSHTSSLMLMYLGLFG